MTAATKSILVIVATLIVGFVAGALTIASIQKSRFDRLVELRRDGGFEEALTRIIDPVDDEQRRQIDAVLDAGGRRMRDAHRKFAQTRRGLMDSLQAELGPILDETQQERLESFVSREQRGRFGRRPQGPPGSGRRGNNGSPPGPPRPPGP